jgi:hypothetical protein
LILGIKECLVECATLCVKGGVILIVYLVRMEYVSKIKIFGLKMIAKRGLEKIFLRFIHARNYFPSFHKLEGFYLKLQIFSNKDYLPRMEGFQNTFFDPFCHFFRPKIEILGTDPMLKEKMVEVWLNNVC